MADSKIRAIVVGASGYTGGELVRLLADHPRCDIVEFVSSSAAGGNVADKIPAWRGRGQKTFQPLSALDTLPAEVVFFATPHAVCMHQAPALLASGKVVIDLGADFRIKNLTVFNQWYGEHSAPQLVDRAVYGLCEVNRQLISDADLIACPGCYATAVELALLPFIAQEHITGDIIVDAKSGTSGAGRQSNRSDLLLAEMANNYKAYGLNGHRHHPEIVQTLEAAGKPVPALTFIPHLLPLARGLFANVYFTMDDPDKASAVLEDYWRGNPFIEVLAPPAVAELAQTIGNNRAILSAHPLAGKQVLVTAALDNLIKGAAGQAVQNMNIRFGLEETDGLSGALAS